MSYLLTGGWLVQRQLQYVEETTYGVTPTSPTLIHAGPITDISDSQEAQAIKYRQVGNRDIYAMIKTGELYSFDVTFNPMDEFLLEYAINLPGVSSRNIGKSLSFVKSALINGTEMFTIYRGARADSIDISITADGAVEVTVSYVCSEITAPSTSHGLTTPAWATNPTTEIPWTNLTPGANPFTYNSVVVDTPSFSCSVTHNLERVKPTGQQTVKFVEPTLRDVTFEFDTWHKDAAIIADIKGSTSVSRDMQYKLSTTKKLAFTKAYVESLGMSDSSSSTTPKIESWTGTAQAVAVATI